MTNAGRLDLDAAFEERFRLIRLLGRGGMGSVFLVEERALRRQVAVKFLHLALSREDALAQKRFLEEGRIAAALRHPNVVQVYDSGISGRHLFLVYEYVEGQSLQDLLDAVGGGPLPTPFVLRVGAAVAAGLAAAHEIGIVHRDIKPDNVLVSSDRALDASGEDFSSIKISDFGIAKMKGREEAVRTRTGIIIGTPTYMSPEQCRGERPGPSTDVYALGAMLYHCLAGRPPYVGKDMEILLGHVKGGMRPLRELAPDLPPGLADLVQSALTLKIEDRCPSARALGDGLLSLLHGPSRRDPPSSPRPPDRTNGRASNAPASERLPKERGRSSARDTAPVRGVSGSRPGSSYSTPTRLGGVEEVPSGPLSAAGRNATSSAQDLPPGPPSPRRLAFLVGALLLLIGAIGLALRGSPPRARPRDVELLVDRAADRVVLAWTSAEAYEGRAGWTDGREAARGAGETRTHRLEWTGAARGPGLLRFGPAGLPASCWIGPTPRNLLYPEWNVDSEGRLLLSFDDLVGRGARIHLGTEDGGERTVDLDGGSPRLVFEPAWLGQGLSIRAMSFTTAIRDGEAGKELVPLACRIVVPPRSLVSTEILAERLVAAWRERDAAVGWSRKAKAILLDDMASHQIFEEGRDALPWRSEPCRDSIRFLENNAPLLRRLLSDGDRHDLLRERVREALFPLRVVFHVVRRYRVSQSSLPETVPAFLAAADGIFAPGTEGTRVLAGDGERPPGLRVLFSAPNANRAIFATCNGQYDKAFSEREINGGGRLGFGISDGTDEHVDKGLRRLSQTLPDLDLYARIASSPFNRSLLARALRAKLEGTDDGARLRSVGLFDDLVDVTAELLCRRRTPWSLRGIEGGDDLLALALERCLTRPTPPLAFGRFRARLPLPTGASRSSDEELRALVALLRNDLGVSVQDLHGLMLQAAESCRDLFLQPMNLDHALHELRLPFSPAPEELEGELEFRVEVYGLHGGEFFLLTLPGREGERHVPFFNDERYYVREDPWFYDYMKSTPSAEVPAAPLPLPPVEKRHVLAARLPGALFGATRNSVKLRLVNVTRNVGSPTTSFLLSVAYRPVPRSGGR